jgi:hypothetical protein
MTIAYIVRTWLVEPEMHAGVGKQMLQHDFRRPQVVCEHRETRMLPVLVVKDFEQIEPLRKTQQDKIKNRVRIPPERLTLWLRLLHDMDRLASVRWKRRERENTIVAQGRPKRFHDDSVIRGHE